MNIDTDPALKAFEAAQQESELLQKWQRERIGELESLLGKTGNKDITPRKIARMDAKLKNLETGQQRDNEQIVTLQRLLSESYTTRVGGGNGLGDEPRRVGTSADRKEIKVMREKIAAYKERQKTMEQQIKGLSRQYTALNNELAERDRFMNGEKGEGPGRFDGDDEETFIFSVDEVKQEEAAPERVSAKTSQTTAVPCTTTKRKPSPDLEPYDDVMFDSGCEDVLPPVKKVKATTAAATKQAPASADKTTAECTSEPGSVASEEQQGFQFKMVCKYHNPDEIIAHDSADMHNVLAELWERIEEVTSLWERKWGDCWYDDNWFHQGWHCGGRRWQCITQKFTGRRTRWQDGDRGYFACCDCLAATRPCFTWTGDVFHLLPLRAEDRLLPVVKDKEIRYWMNL